MLSGLVKQKKPMIRTNLIISTKKQKSGGNTYFSVGIKTGSTVELSDTDKELLKEFMVAVKSVNESVMEKHRSAVKSKTKDGDHSLAIELDN
jgi:hypothetical protein